MDPKTKNYQIRPEYIAPLKASVQNAAIEGKHGLKDGKFKGHYHNSEHFDLISKIVPLRNAFRHPNATQKKQLSCARREIEAWVEYVERRKDRISQIEEYWMQEGSRVLLKESFDRLKNRDTQCVDSSDLIEAHGLFAKSYKFKVPIHPKNLS